MLSLHGCAWLFLAVALLVPDCDHPTPTAGRPGLLLLYLPVAQPSNGGPLQSPGQSLSPNPQALSRGQGPRLSSNLLLGRKCPQSPQTFRPGLSDFGRRVASNVHPSHFYGVNLYVACAVWGSGDTDKEPLLWSSDIATLSLGLGRDGSQCGWHSWCVWATAGLLVQILGEQGRPDKPWFP